jgi:hypothetical protein
VRADVVTYDVGSTVANTLHELGTDFIGCANLAAGVVAAYSFQKRSERYARPFAWRVAEPRTHHRSIFAHQVKPFRPDTLLFN